MYFLAISCEAWYTKSWSVEHYYQECNAKHHKVIILRDYSNQQKQETRKWNSHPGLALIVIFPWKKKKTPKQTALKVLVLCQNLPQLNVDIRSQTSNKKNLRSISEIFKQPIWHQQPQHCQDLFLNPPFWTILTFDVNINCSSWLISPWLNALRCCHMHIFIC